MSHRSGSSAPPPMTASAPRPTPCRPGTPGKVAEMARRAERGLPLFHPGDAPASKPGGLPRGVSVHRKAKRYKDWRAVFRKAVRGNWLKLWLCDGEGYRLSTIGIQAQRAKAATA